MNQTGRNGSEDESSDVNTTNTTLVPESVTDRDTSLITAPPSPNNDDKIGELVSIMEYTPVSPSYSETSPTYHTPGEDSDGDDNGDKVPDSSGDESEEQVRIMRAHYRNKEMPTTMPKPINPEAFKNPEEPFLIDPILDVPAKEFQVPREGFPRNDKARIILSSPGQVAKLRLP